MKHFFITKEYDGYIDVLEKRTDYEVLSSSQCKLCHFRPNKIWYESEREIANEIEVENNDFERCLNFELLIRGNNYIYKRIVDRYNLKMKDHSECKVNPRVIKTRDIEFVDFLVENGYEIKGVIPISRQKEFSTESSQNNVYKGIFRYVDRSHTSSYHKAERRDIAEYTLVKENGITYHYE